SVVSTASPAKIGETVQIFLTGLGPVNPAVAAGAAGPTNPLSVVTNNVEVTVDGIAAKVLYQMYRFWDKLIREAALCRHADRICASRKIVNRTGSARLIGVGGRQQVADSRPEDLPGGELAHPFGGLLLSARPERSRLRRRSR